MLGGDPITLEELDLWEISFRDFQARFAHLFNRSESRQQALKYVRGLLAPLERKNGWQMAQAIGDARPDAKERRSGARHSGALRD